MMMIIKRTTNAQPTRKSDCQVKESAMYYFVNASRGWDFQFAECESFDELESIVDRLTLFGYEVTAISLIEGEREGFAELEKRVTAMQEFWQQHAAHKPTLTQKIRRRLPRWISDWI